MDIQLLPAAVVAQIAAGEVIERPVNAVKELIENSIDAGARSIKALLAQGGLDLIQVEDDGAGIPADSLALAFQRHATSKLQEARQLDSIATLGFRGEALFSIGAVSHVTVVSRPPSAAQGGRIRLEGGAVVQRGAAGRAPGTTVQVENLFVNAPVRQRFLKSAAAEAGRVSRLVQRYALAHPEISFEYRHNDRLLFRTHGQGDVRGILYDLHGGALARSLLPIADAQAELAIAGYAGPPTVHFPNRGKMETFVNGRWIQDRALLHAAAQAYRGRLPSGRFPLVVLFLDVNPALVDVNAHPQKMEVRFLRERWIYASLRRAVERTLQEALGLPAAGAAERTFQRASAAPRRAPRAAAQTALPLALPKVARERRAHARVPSQEASAQAAPRRTDLPALNIVGQVGAMYIVAESDRGLVLVDQHAAHERVLFESWMAKARQAPDAVPRQILLAPQTLHVGTEQAGLVAQHLDLLRRLGFEIEEFGGESFVVRAVPALLTHRAPEAVVEEALEALARHRNLVAEELESQLVKLICKKASIKAGQVLSLDEMETLLRQLEACRAPLTCPHGRPTLIQFSAQALAQAFGRS